MWAFMESGGSFSWLSVPNIICLVGSLLGGTTIPYLRQSSFMSLSWKKLWNRGCLSISFVFCRIILTAGWYCNLNSHPQASVPCPPEDTVAMQWCKRILSDFSLKEKFDPVRGSNSFQLSRMHLKGICREVDWLFPI